MADAFDTARPKEPLLRVRDLGTLASDDVVPVLSEIARETEGGPAAIERILVLTAGEVPDSVPALTDTAVSLGYAPGVMHIAHMDDYVPAPPVDCGSDAAAADAAVPARGLYDLFDPDTEFHRGPPKADEPEGHWSDDGNPDYWIPTGGVGEDKSLSWRLMNTPLGLVLGIGVGVAVVLVLILVVGIVNM